MSAVPSSPAVAGDTTGHRPAPDRIDPGCRRQHRIAISLLVAIWLAFTFPAFTGKARFPVSFAGPAPGQDARTQAVPELGGDAFYAFYPWHSYLGDRLRSGRLPLWDPFRFAGTPFSADTATGTFYPPNWLYASGHVLLTFTVIAVASFLASLLLAFWFLRLVRLHPYAAALGAVIWTFSAFLMKWSTNECVFGSAMWLPLALGGLEMARRGRPRRGMVLAAAGLGLSVLAGHAQVALIVWMATALWVLVGVGFTVVTKDDTDGSSVRHQLTTAAAAFGLALGLAAVQLLPTAQFAGLIVRQQTSFDLAQLTGLPAEHAPTLLLPDYLGSPADGNWEGSGVNYTETALYAGILTLPLAALGLRRRPGRLTVFFGLITVVGVLCSFGSPFYRLILALPGFDRTLFVTRFILFVDVGLAGLAAVGLHSLLVEPARRSVNLLLGLLAGVVALLGFLTVFRITPLPASYITPRGLQAIGLTVLCAVAVGWLALRPSRAAPVAVILVTLVAVDLWRSGRPFNPYESPRQVYVRSPAVEYLAARNEPRPRYANVSSYSIVPNGGLEFRLYGIEGYDPLVPKRIVELFSLAEDQLAKARLNYFGAFEPATFLSPVVDLLGIRTAVAPLGFPGTVAGNAVMIDRPTAFPPAFLASCWERTSDVATLDRLRSMSTSDLRGTAIVAGAAGSLPPDPFPASCRSAGDVSIERYEPERVVARASSDTASVLVLTDAWFPGWSVTVDGKPAAMLRVDHALRGVALPAGEHRVEFRFRPRVLATGGGVTAVSLLFLVGLALASRRERDAARPGRTDSFE